MKADFQALILAHNTVEAGKFLMNHKELAPLIPKNPIFAKIVTRGRNNTYWVAGQLCANKLCAVAYIIAKGCF